MTQSVEPVVDKSTNAEGIQELKSQSKPEIFEDGTEKHIPHPLEMQLLNLLENEIVAKGKPEDQIRVIKEIGDLVDLEMPEIDGKKASEMPLDDAKSIREQATNIGNEKPEDVVIPDLRSEYQKKWERTETEKQNTVEDWRIEGEGPVAKMGQEIASMRETMREISSHVARYEGQWATIKAINIKHLSTEAVTLRTQFGDNPLESLQEFLKGGDNLEALQKEYEGFVMENCPPQEKVEVVEPAKVDANGQETKSAVTRKVKVVSGELPEASQAKWQGFLAKNSENLSKLKKKDEADPVPNFAKELDQKRTELVLFQKRLKELASKIQMENIKRIIAKDDNTPPLDDKTVKVIEDIINEPRLNTPWSKWKIAALGVVGIVGITGIYALKHGISEGMEDAGVERPKNPVQGLSGLQQAMLLKNGFSHREVAMIDEEVKERSRIAQEAKGEEESSAEPPTPLAPSPATSAPPTTPSPTTPTPPADAESTA